MDLHPLLKLNFVFLSMTIIFILALLFNEVNYVFGHKRERPRNFVMFRISPISYWFGHPKMAFFLCVTDSFLGPPLTDFIETLRVYGADPELVQRHTFDFRFQPRTGSE